MKFVERIGCGEITIRDNQLIELKPTTTTTTTTTATSSAEAAQWSEEFGAASGSVDAAAAQWSDEFRSQQETRFSPPQLDWAQQYLDASLREVKEKISKKLVLGYRNLPSTRALEIHIHVCTCTCHVRCMYKQRLLLR